MPGEPEATTRTILTATRTDAGRRKNNEDVAVLMEGPAKGRPAGDLLFGVVDGMGGYQAGEIAAAIARDALYECFAVGGEDVRAWLMEAHRAVVKSAQESPERQGMGAVLSIALLSGGRLHVAHIGDSRLYRLRKGALEQITPDQSAVGELVRAGKLTKEVARTHHMSNVVYQAIGHPDRTPEPFVSVLDVEGKDLYLAASDGLTDVITDAQAEAILNESKTLEEAAEGLIKAALTDQEAIDVNGNPVRIPGGRDNVTVALVEVASAGKDEDAASQQGVGVLAKKAWRSVSPRTLVLALIVAVALIAVGIVLWRGSVSMGYDTQPKKPDSLMTGHTSPDTAKQDTTP